MDTTKILLQAFQEWLEINKQKGVDEPYMNVGKKSYTIREIVQEIEDNSEFGQEFVRDMFLLTIDLITRGKREIPIVDPKKFSKKDMLNNFTKYMEEGGFNFNDTPYDRLKSYIDWLDKEIV